MKRYLLLCCFVLAGCSQHGQSINQEGHDTAAQSINLTIPEHIFHSDNNGTLTEEQIKQDITTYLDSDDQLTKQSDFITAVSMPHNELSPKNKKKVRKIILLTQQNDKNFKKYVISHQFPGEYQQEIKRISRYISASNEYLNVLCKKLEKKNASIEIIESLSHVPTNANGREQLKIERFLKEKNIRTQAFDKQN